MAIKRFELLVKGTTPDGPTHILDQNREALFKAAETALSALSNYGIYITHQAFRYAEPAKGAAGTSTTPDDVMAVAEAVGVVPVSGAGPEPTSPKPSPDSSSS